jgi:lipid II:glycine glycyltransferase (peptidoglycan interpeptide bridge formation enzyme)
MIEIITNRDEWNRFMRLIGHFDFYFTYYYHFLSKKEDEKPVLIAYREAGTVIALPLLLRDIEGTSYRDATSVYGYAGPLCKTDNGDPLTFDTSRFKTELQRFLLNNKIVSVFTRLHPYICYQEHLLSDIGTIISPGSVVNIDLTLPVDIQRQKYSSRLKTYINKARRLYSIVEGKEENQIEEFIEMYYENMRRVEAEDYYFFDKRYFYQLMISSFFKVELLLCSDTRTGELIGGAMFVKTDKIVQYHLSGCKEEYLSLNPIKLLIDEMRIRATAENYTYFNLGGGKGVKRDSLFRFKSSFSKDFKPAQFWKYIVNREVYDQLVAEAKKPLTETRNVETDFFPTYRQRTERFKANS